jgi:hypothetical protein
MPRYYYYGGGLKVRFPRTHGKTSGNFRKPFAGPFLFIRNYGADILSPVLTLMRVMFFSRRTGRFPLNYNRVDFHGACRSGPAAPGLPRSWGARMKLSI